MATSFPGPFPWLTSSKGAWPFPEDGYKGMQNQRSHQLTGNILFISWARFRCGFNSENVLLHTLELVGLFGFGRNRQEVLVSQTQKQIRVKLELFLYIRSQKNHNLPRVDCRLMVIDNKIDHLDAKSFMQACF